MTIEQMNVEQVIADLDEIMTNYPETAHDLPYLRDFLARNCPEFMNDLTWSEAYHIDNALFGHTQNAYWTEAYNFPKPGDIIDGQTVGTVGIFTFAFVEQSDSESEFLKYEQDVGTSYEDLTKSTRANASASSDDSDSGSDDSDSGSDSGSDSDGEGLLREINEQTLDN